MAADIRRLRSRPELLHKHWNVAFVYRASPLTSIDPPLICHATLRPEKFPGAAGDFAGR
jgi:hypothetical protein